MIQETSLMKLLKILEATEMILEHKNGKYKLRADSSHFICILEEFYTFEDMYEWAITLFEDVKEDIDQDIRREIEAL